MVDSTEARLQQALTLHQAGDVGQAVALYEQVLRAEANNPVALNYLGVTRLQAGRLEEASQLIEQSLRYHPEYVAALNNLGTVRQTQNRYADAVEIYDQVLRLEPASAVAQHNRANGLLELGKNLAARDGFEHALRIQPDYTDALCGLATSLRRLAYFAEAIEVAKRATQVDQKSIAAWNQYGLALRDNGQADRAVEIFQRVVEQQPRNVSAQLNLAMLLTDLGKTDEASGIVEVLTKQCPDDVDVLQLRAKVALGAGDPEGALIDYERALAVQPSSAELLYGVALVQRGLGMLDEAVSSLQAAIEACPEDVRYLNSLANVLRDQGHADEALRVYELSRTLNSANPATLWNLAALHQRQADLEAATADLDQLETMLTARHLDSQRVWCNLRKTCLVPTVMQSTDAIEQYRQQMLDQLPLANEVELTSIDQLERYGSFPPLALLHHGSCNRQIKQAFGSRFERHFAGTRTGGRVQRKVPRVGFFVSRGHEGVFLRCMRGIIDRLDGDVLNVFVIGDHAARRRFARTFESPHVQIVPVTNAFRTLAGTIAELDLDLLYHWEVGTDATNYFLPMMQLARVQATGWGVPDTTGLDSIDYYFSSELVESNDSAANYTEQLMVASELLTFQESVRNSSEAGNSAPPGEDARDASTGSRYLCVQNLGKVHPNDDQLWADILRSDPSSTLTLFRDQAGRASDELRRRWQTLIPDVEPRIKFLEPLPYADFLATLRRYDVLLDTLNCGGGLTTYDTLALGKLIVTLPGQFARNRYTAACYLQMELGELIAQSREDYVNKAVQFATDRRLRQEAEKKIQNAASQLFRRDSAAFEFQRMLVAAIQGSPP